MREGDGPPEEWKRTGTRSCHSLLEEWSGLERRSGDGYLQPAGIERRRHDLVPFRFPGGTGTDGGPERHYYRPALFLENPCIHTIPAALTSLAEGV
jgi:hypothetical protein